MVQLNPATSSFASVTGTATLGGATVNAQFSPGNYVSKQFILTATGGLGGTTFSGVTNIGLPQGASDSLSYSADDVFLNLKAGFTNYAGLNVNQQNVANALTNFFNATGGIPSVFFGLSPSGLTQVSGELATGSQQTTFDAMNLFMGVMTDPFANGRGDAGTAGAGAATGYASTQSSGATHDAYAMFTKAPPVAPFEARWSTWAAGFGGSQTTDGNATLGSNNTTSSVYGTAVGADYRISPYTIAGFALAGGGTNFNVAGSGSGHSDLFQAGAYIRHDVGAAYVSAALAYGWQDITTNRTVTAAGLINCARSSTPMHFRGVSKAAIGLSRPGSAASASRLTRPRNSPHSICLPMPSRRPSAQTPSRWLMVPRTSPIPAANSASAPTNPGR